MLKKFRSSLVYLLVTLGFLASLMIILAFTTAPFWAWYNLGVKKAGINRTPDYIIVMGGGGMPSQSGLMRCWFSAGIAKRFPGSRIIIALPGDRHDSLSSVNLMKKELELRGIAPERIFLEDSGTNTRAEALYVYKLISELEGQGSKIDSTRNLSTVTLDDSLNPSRFAPHASLLIVTSPEHLCRAVLSFKKAGFLKVDGLPTFEKAIEADLDFNSHELGAPKWTPDVGKNLTLRYQFWMQMEYEFLILREYLALAYYKIQGWI